ncbi:MAG: MOP flippase family protein, partial [Gammaproteobacteria bacterium]
MSLAESAASGAKWSLISVTGRRLMSLVTSIVLARLLSPTDFGLVAMAAVFVGFIELLRDMGTGAGIVQTSRPTDELLSSVFWLNVGLGVVATALLLALAPLAAMLFRESRLILVLQGLSISVLFAALSVVQTSLLTRQMRFRRLAIVELTGSLAGGVLGIALALSGYAVWSLVWQSVCSVLLVSAGTCLVSEWRPRFVFQLSSLRSILGFSANLTGFNLLNYFVRNADNFLIGRYLGAQNLGLYDLAYRVMLYPLHLVSWALGRALFPVYARMQTDHARLGAAYLKVTRAIALIVFPMMLGLVAVAEPFVQTVVGAAWSSVTPLLFILGPLAAYQAIGTTVGHIYQATGRTDVLLRWGAGAGTLLVASFVVGLQWGIVGVAACYAIVSYALAYHTFKIPLGLIGLPVSQVFDAVIRPLVCSLIMLIVVLALHRLLPDTLSAPVLLSVLVPAGVTVYVCATW